jgi:hypothetical protein
MSAETRGTGRGMGVRTTSGKISRKLVSGAKDVTGHKFKIGQLVHYYPKSTLRRGCIRSSNDCRVPMTANARANASMRFAVRSNSTIESRGKASWRGPKDLLAPACPVSSSKTASMPWTALRRVSNRCLAGGRRQGFPTRAANAVAATNRSGRGSVHLFRIDRRRY